MVAGGGLAYPSADASSSASAFRLKSFGTRGGHLRWVRTPATRVNGCDLWDRYVTAGYQIRSVTAKLTGSTTGESSRPCNATTIWSRNVSYTTFPTSPLKLHGRAN